MISKLHISYMKKRKSELVKNRYADQWDRMESLEIDQNNIVN